MHDIVFSVYYGLNCAVHLYFRIRCFECKTGKLHSMLSVGNYRAGDSTEGPHRFGQGFGMGPSGKVSGQSVGR